MTTKTTVARLIKDALDYLLAVQEIAAKPYMIGKVVDVPAIREQTYKAAMKLLEADAILSLPGKEGEAYGYYD